MKYSLSKAQIVYLFIPPLALTTVCILTIVTELPLFATIITLAVALITWHSYMSIPYEAEIGENGIVKFKSFLVRKAILLNEVSYVNASKWNKGFVDIHYNKGKMSLLRGMEGLENIIDHIKSKNMSVRIKGGFD